MKCHGDNYPGCLSWLESQITHPACRMVLFIGRAAERPRHGVTALQRMTSNASVFICMFAGSEHRTLIVRACAFIYFFCFVFGTACPCEGQKKQKHGIGQGTTSSTFLCSALH